MFLVPKNDKKEIKEEIIKNNKNLDINKIKINYFGFLLSSQIYKSNYKYNTSLTKNDLNKLYKDNRGK